MRIYARPAQPRRTYTSVSLLATICLLILEKTILDEDWEEREYATIARTFREAAFRCADPGRRIDLHWAAFQIEAQLRGLKPT